MTLIVLTSIITIELYDLWFMYYSYNNVKMISFEVNNNEVEAGEII